MTQVIGQFEATAATDDAPPVKAPGRAYEVVKRAIDIAGALAGLAATAPVVGFCAAWIWLRDGRPILYRQWRAGRDGWLFRIYKLRTMRKDAEWTAGAQWAARNDPRVIPGCRWMRKSHVDELPQLWNILFGHMSIVGPRPERPEMLEALRESIPNVEARLAGRPGLTGLAQIRSGYTDDLEGSRRKLADDLQYLRKRGLWMELKLVAMTIPRLWDRTAH